jgi:hypothetical protein
MANQPQDLSNQAPQMPETPQPPESRTELVTQQFTTLFEKPEFVKVT